MANTSAIQDFLSNYDDTIFANAMQLRKLILSALPAVTEQLDIPARMIAYCYGQKYAELVCTIIPSKKGLKLGFNRGVDLPDPGNLLEGSGKISKYVVIKSNADIANPALKQLLKDAYTAYLERTSLA
ncbi:MAG: DUF1801 domain-containing protein [Taibaiella sp.]|nr:DUF1801 domain-containing protein [Taibaiella sp.]